MPKINVAGGTHGSFTRFAGTPDEERYEPYPEGGSLTMLRRAIRIIGNNIYKKNVHCGSYFKLLPGGRTFDEVWEDADIWISYDPRVTNAFFGATNGAGGKEVTIYEDAFRKGHWWVVGTVVHELAHTNGAGGPPSIAAETALKYCGLRALFDPGAVGLAPTAESGGGTRMA